MKVSKLPDSLSHIDLSKFLENEPGGNQGPVSSTPVNDEQGRKRAEANNTVNKVSLIEKIRNSCYIL